MAHVFDTMAKLCVEHLARDIQVDTTNIDIVAGNSCMWPDSSMGIPEGIYYPPEPIQGFRIVLRNEDKNYQYHTDLISRVKQFRIL